MIIADGFREKEDSSLYAEWNESQETPVEIKPEIVEKIIGDETTETAEKSYKIYSELSENQIIFGGNYFTDFLFPSRCWIVWDKVGENNFKNPFSDVELAWTSFSKVCKKYLCIQQGFVNEDKKQPRLHPTQKPLKLFECILQDYTNEGDLILDCFSGSGTTAVACHNLKRRFICIEKDKDYYEASVKRLEDEQKQMTLF